MINRDVVTVKATVTGLRSGTPPMLCCYERLLVMGGKQKTFTRWLRVPDEELFHRLQDNVRPGDEIEITVTTDWDDNSYETYLTDFAPAAQRQPAEPTARPSAQRKSKRRLPA